MADLAILDVSAGFYHFEPIEVANRFGALAQGIVDRFINAVFRRADDFDLLVGVVVRHGVFSTDEYLNASRERPIS
ncbi:hypothetical protein D9M68_960430 [compost metagenome]